MKNYYEITGDITAIRIDSKRHGTKWTLIDTDKLEIMPKGRISLSNGYAIYWDGKTAQKLHRLIMNFPELGIDHIYGETLDNRRESLREATKEQNDHNRKPQGGSSNYKGVNWYKGKWQARICVNGEQKYLGYFTDEIEAAWNYDQAAIFYFGEFAWLNF